MNIAEILKNVPKGTKLYSPIFGEVTFMCTSGLYIEVLDSINIIREFWHDGRFYKNGECMLFPSRGNRDWNNFYICPFKKGDFIVKESINGIKFLAIFSHLGGPYEYTTNYLCLLRPDGKFKPKSDFGIGNVQELRLATDSEKKELLDVIERNGYTWNSDTLILEENHKYNIYSLKPFDRVLTRDHDIDVWSCEFYSHYRIDLNHYNHVCSSGSYHQCIPYNDDTKHLVGTTEDCPEYYKTW